MIVFAGCTSRSVQFSGISQDSHGRTYYNFTNDGAGSVTKIDAEIQWIDSKGNHCGDSHIITPFDPPIQPGETRAVSAAAPVGCLGSIKVGFMHLSAEYSDGGEMTSYSLYNYTDNKKVSRIIQSYKIKPLLFEGVF